ncbi:MAG: hypothetical protein ACPMAQ_11345 [Phycisphaerae bacterium]
MDRTTGDIADRTSGFGGRSVPIGGALPRSAAVRMLGGPVAAAGASGGGKVRRIDSAATSEAFVHPLERGLRACCRAIDRPEIPVEAGIGEPERTGPLVQEGREIERILATVVRKSKQRVKA